MTRALGIDVGASGVRAKIVDAIETVARLRRRAVRARFRA